MGVEEEKQLREMVQELVDAKASLEVIMVKLHKSVDAVQKKCARLGLEVVDDAKKIRASSTSSSGLKLPAELPSVEEALKKLVAAMNALETPDLSNTEVLRLRSLIQADSVYQVKVAEYIGYREIEAKLAKMEENYERLLCEKPRTWRPLRVMSRYQRLELLTQKAKDDAVKKALQLSADPVEFFEQVWVSSLFGNVWAKVETGSLHDLAVFLALFAATSLAMGGLIIRRKKITSADFKSKLRHLSANNEE